MFCEQCGASLPEDANFCPDCGWKIPQKEQPQKPPPDKAPDAKEKKEDKPSKWKLLMSAVVWILMITAIIYAVQKHPVKDLKNVVFNDYGTETLGDAVASSLINTSWDAEKISKTNYHITLTGYSTELYSDLEITFRLTYGDGCVYAKIDHLLWDGDYHDDWFTTSLALSTIYGN